MTGMKKLWLLLCCLFLASCTVAQDASSFVPSSREISSEAVSSAEESTLSEEEIRALAERVFPDLEQRFYIRQLRGEMLRNLCVLYEACQNFEVQCLLSTPLAEEDVDLLLTYLDYDCPELIQYDSEMGWGLTRNGEGLVTSVIPSYRMSKKVHKNYYAETERALDEICGAARGMSDFEAECLVYRELISRYTYHAKAANCNNAYGLLIAKTARCEGIARTFLWAMRKLNIPAFCIMANNADGDPHAWNAVQIGGEWYDVDITHDDYYDDGEKFPIAYGSVNLPSDFKRRDYTLWDACTAFGDLPQTDSVKDNYHVRMNAWYTTAEEGEVLLRRLLDEAESENADHLSLQSLTAWEALDKRLPQVIDDWCQTAACRSVNYTVYCYPSTGTIYLKLKFNF